MSSSWCNNPGVTKVSANDTLLSIHDETAFDWLLALRFFNGNNDDDRSVNVNQYEKMHPTQGRPLKITSLFVWSSSRETRQVKFLFNHPPCAAYIPQWIGIALDQVMACRLFGVKSLSEPMMAYRQLDSWEQTSVKFWIGIILFSFLNYTFSTSYSGQIYMPILSGSVALWIKLLCFCLNYTYLKSYTQDINLDWLWKISHNLEMLHPITDYGTAFGCALLNIMCLYLYYHVLSWYLPELLTCLCLRPSHFKYRYRLFETR